MTGEEAGSDPDDDGSEHRDADRRWEEITLALGGLAILGFEPSAVPPSH